MYRKQYDEVCKRTDLLSGFMMFKDKDMSLEKIVESAIYYYIQGHPTYSANRILHVIGNISDLPRHLESRLIRAYPNKDFNKLKKIDVDKLFTDWDWLVHSEYKISIYLIYLKERKMEMSNFAIEGDELSINDFMCLYETDGDPIDEIIQVTVQTYIRKFLGEMTPKEIVSHLSEYGDGFKYHVRYFFEN